MNIPDYLICGGTVELSSIRNRITPTGKRSLAEVSKTEQGTLKQNVWLNFPHGFVTLKLGFKWVFQIMYKVST